MLDGTPKLREYTLSKLPHEEIASYMEEKGISTQTQKTPEGVILKGNYKGFTWALMVVEKNLPKVNNSWPELVHEQFLYRYNAWQKENEE